MSFICCTLLFLSFHFPDSLLFDYEFFIDWLLQFCSFICTTFAYLFLCLPYFRYCFPCWKLLIFTKNKIYANCTQNYFLSAFHSSISLLGLLFMFLTLQTPTITAAIAHIAVAANIPILRQWMVKTKNTIIRKIWKLKYKTSPKIIVLLSNIFSNLPSYFFQSLFYCWKYSQSHPQFHHSIYDRFQVFSFYPEHIKCHIQAFILWLQLTKESFFSISFSSPSS